MSEMCSGVIGNNIRIESTHTSSEKNEPIAVIGMTCRLPGANNISEFWDLLIDDNGYSQTPQLYPRPTSRVFDKSEQIPMNFLSMPIDEMDNEFFGISPVELKFLDPQIRLLMELAWEAFEDAGIDPSSLAGSNTSVFTGAFGDEFKSTLNHNCSIAEDFFRKSLGGLGSTAARLAHIFKATGPCYAFDAVCTSSMVAVHQAIQSLRHGDTSLALACGVNLILQPFSDKDLSGLCPKDGRCKTFDAKADGFARAEGCGVLVLKKYADAIKNGDQIHGVIKGSAVVQDGTSTSLMTPTIHSEALAMKLALKDANLNPDQVSYVEAHGTGTSIGDPIEINAIAETYGSCKRTEPLIISSVKTNIGHTESCSGIVGIIKTILALQNQLIPKHKNFAVLNPKINLERIPASIPIEHTVWPLNCQKSRYAGVSCFGMTGTQAHVILQEVPPVENNTIIAEKTNCEQRPYHILSISAKSSGALQDMVNEIETCLDDPCWDIGDFAFSLNTGRSQSFKHRAVIIGQDAKEMKHNISFGNITFGKAGKVLPKICFLFPGFGSSYEGMTTELYSSCPIFRRHFDECDEHLITKWNMSLKNYVNGGETNELDKLHQSQPGFSQTLTFLVEYCLLKTWEFWGIKPDYVLGHSIGEFAACVAAGVTNLNDTIDMLVERNNQLRILKEGGMMAVNCNVAKVKSLLTSSKITGLDISAINTDSQTILAGTTEAVSAFSEFSKQQNIKCTILKAIRPFHSRYIRDISAQTYGCHSKFKYLAPTKCTYISGLTGNILKNEEQIDANYWVRHAEDTVRFKPASLSAYNEKCRIFLEIGATPLLSTFVTANLSGLKDPITCIPSLRKNVPEWYSMLSSLGELQVLGFTVNWKNFENEFPFRKRVQVPHYQFQRKLFSIPDATAINDKITTTNSLHPLLGSVLSNATGTQIFQQNLKLSLLPWIGDHKIGENVILPAAAYLEMLLFTGMNNNKTWSPIRIQNLVIKKPLAIEDSVMIQTTVTPSNINSTDSIVQIYSYQEDKWIQHSGATLISDFETAHEETNIEIHNYKEWGEFDVTTKFYEKISQASLNFGIMFKSLKKVWKNDKTLVAELTVPDDSNEYLMHPILIDGMIQAALLNNCSQQELTELSVPIAVKEFTWLRKPESQTVKVFAFKTRDSADVLLFDSANKNLLAIMKGIVFTKTSLHIISGEIFRPNRNSLPDIYEEEWKPTLGPLEHRLDMQQSNLFLPQLSDEKFTFKENAVYEAVNELCFLYVQKALYQIGWNPELGQVLKPIHFCSEFGLEIKFCRLVSRFFEILAQEHYLVGMKNDQGEWMEWSVIKMPPSTNKISKRVSEILLQLGYNTSSVAYGPLNAVVKCGEQISNILQDKLTAQQVLFGPMIPGKNWTIAQEIYATHPWNTCLLSFCKEGFRSILTQLISSPLNKKGTLRILEVGCGTGNGAQAVLPILEELAGTSSYLYTFTDISDSFFPSAQKQFKKYSNQINYKVLDMEKDPLDQGFHPEQFDIILGLNTFHICKDLSQCLRKLRSILNSKSGLLFVAETTIPLRDVDITFGLFDDHWLFQDTTTRPNHFVISSEEWKQLLFANGFDLAHSLEGYNGHCALIVARATNTTELKHLSNPDGHQKVYKIFSDESELSRNFERRLQELNIEVVLVTKETDMEKCMRNVFKKYGSIEGIIYLWGCNIMNEIQDQELISKPFVFLAQFLTRYGWEKVQKLFLVTQGLNCIGEDCVVQNPSSATLTGIIKALGNELPTITCKIIEINNPADKSQESLDEVFMELWNDDKELHVCYNNRTRFLARLVKNNNHLIPSPLSLSNSPRYGLEIPSTKSIRDLKFTQKLKVGLKNTEIEIAVKSSGLNLQDILTIMKPTEEFQEQVGLEFAGVITAVGLKVANRKVGDFVYGWKLDGGTCQSHIVVPADLVTNVPHNWTLSYAATLPFCFLTAYHCLVTVGGLQSGETILIHTGSGGIGLCAIQLAKYLKANIITTADTCRNRTYLKNVMKIEHVFDSKTLEFEKQILQVTNNRGVDMVLNSLTGLGCNQASLSICAPGARFIEMSKQDTCTVGQVRTKRPDVKFRIADVTKTSKEVQKKVYKELEELIQTNVIKPLPYTRFEMMNIREAFKYFQTAKHIGKVILELPETKIVLGKSLRTAKLFNDKSTYLITGGYGGIGFEVAKWMANTGAKYIALVGRNKPNAAAKSSIKTLTETGTYILCLQADVGEYDQCEQILNDVKGHENMPPLRGIMHAAGVLDSAILSNITWSNFESPYNAKIKGAWNLHDLTTQNGYSYYLQHFVMFSSVVALIGYPGLSNHAAACSFLDALANFRNARGLSALSINWGTWGQMGEEAAKTLPGHELMNPKKAILALEALIKAPNTSNRKCVAQMDCNFTKNKFPNISNYLESFVTSTNKTTGVEKEETFGQKYKIQPAVFHEEFKVASDRKQVVAKHLEAVIRQILMLSPQDYFDKEDTLANLGLDSLISIQLKSSLELLTKEEDMVDLIYDSQTFINLTSDIVKALTNRSNE